MYPVDLLKVRPQNAPSGGAVAVADPQQTRMQIINPSPGAIYTGITNAISTIARVEGAHSLWRGISSVILGAGMDTAAMWCKCDLTAGQVRRMRSTSQHTKQSRHPWVATS